MKKVISGILCIVLCLSLCACGGVQSDLRKGIWCREFSALGINMLEEYEFESNGKFVKMNYMNGAFSDMEMGTYEVIETQTVLTYDSGEEYEAKKSQIVLTFESGEKTEIDYTYEAGELKLTLGKYTMYNRSSKS